MIPRRLTYLDETNGRANTFAESGKVYVVLGVGEQVVVQASPTTWVTFLSLETDRGEVVICVTPNGGPTLPAFTRAEEPELIEVEEVIADPIDNQTWLVRFIWRENIYVVIDRVKFWVETSTNKDDLHFVFLLRTKEGLFTISQIRIGQYQVEEFIPTGGGE